jgi:hypothetical protein
VKYARSDDDFGMRGNESSARVEINSGHATVSAYLDSSELYAMLNPSRIDLRRHASMREWV